MLLVILIPSRNPIKPHEEFWPYQPAFLLWTFSQMGSVLRRYLDAFKQYPQLPGCVYVCMYGYTYSKSMDQSFKVASPARGQLNRKIEYYISLSPFAPENLVSRDGFGSPVPCQPAHLHTQAESGPYLRDSPRVPRRRPFIY